MMDLLLRTEYTPPPSRHNRHLVVGKRQISVQSWKQTGRTLRVRRDWSIEISKSWTHSVHSQPVFPFVMFDRVPLKETR